MTKADIGAGVIVGILFITLVGGMQWLGASYARTSTDTRGAYVWPPASGGADR